jgi:hypothetical protein
MESRRLHLFSVALTRASIPSAYCVGAVETSDLMPTTAR